MLAKIKDLIKLYKLPLLSGFLIGTSYAPFPPWAAVFALVPLWIFWLNHSHSLKKIVISGVLTGFVLTMIGFNWVAHTAQEFGHFPWPVAILVLIAFALLANLHVAIAGFFWFFVGRYFRLRKELHILCLPLIMALANAYLQLIFHWNYGYSFLWVRWPIYQLAEITGFQGLSSLIMVLNLMFLYSVLADDKKEKLKKFGYALGLFLILNLAGWALQLSLPKYDAETHVAIVQANIGNLEKQAAEKGPMYRDHIVATYSRLTKEAIKNADGNLDFIVWPETAFPATIYPNGDGDYHVQNLKYFIRDLNIPLVTGGYGFNTQENRYTNSLFIVDRNGEFQENNYVKTHLLAFGEYIPLSSQFPILKKWIPAGDFLPGIGANVLDLNGLRLGPQICYEGLYPYFSRDLAQQNAQIIINVTNDSWFGMWQEPFQHMIMTFARGIELRRPVIRSTNTGVSTVSLADGRILEKSPLHKEWTGSYHVPYYKNPPVTLYQMFPWLMDVLFVCLLGLILFRGYFERIQKT